MKVLAIVTSLTIALLSVVLFGTALVFFGAIDYSEKEWGLVTRANPLKPIPAVSDKTIERAINRNFERETSGFAKTIANTGSDAKLDEYIAKRDKLNERQARLHGDVFTPQAGASYGSANLEEFRVINSDPTAGEYEFQLDARQVWQATKVVVHGPAKVTIKGTGQVCSGDANCVGPNGQDGPAKTSRFQPEDFPVGEAFCQALVVKFGDTILRQVGSEKTFDLPAGVHEVSFMANIRKSWVHVASGGFRVTMLVQ